MKKMIFAMTALFAAFCALAGSIPKGELLTSPQDPSQGELRYWIVDLQTQEYVGFGAWEGTDCAVRSVVDGGKHDAQPFMQRIEVRAALRTRNRQQAPAYTAGELRRLLSAVIDILEEEGNAEWREQMDSVFLLRWAEKRQEEVVMNDIKPSQLLFTAPQSAQMAAGNGGVSRNRW